MVDSIKSALPQQKREWEPRVSVCRLAALTCIFAHHVIQHYDLPIDSLLAFGVQLFLCISAYLYGKSRIGGGLSFIVKNAKKLFVDYYLLIIPVIALYVLYARGTLSRQSALDLLLLRSFYVPGLRHFWYLPLMMFCYCITPLLSQAADAWRGCSRLSFFLRMLFVWLLIEIASGYLSGFSKVNILCYTAFFLLSSRNPNPKTYLYLACVTTPAFLAIFFWRLLIPLEAETSQIALYFRGLGGEYSPVLLAFSAFGICYYACTKFRLERSALASRLLRYVDRYAYQFYLVHYIWMESPFGLMDATGNRIFNCLLAVGACALLAVLLRSASLRVTRLAGQIFDKVRAKA